MAATMAAVSLTQQQYQQFIDKISGLEARATLQTHAEAQQEQIRMAEVVMSRELLAGNAWNGEARGYHRHRMALLTESVNPRKEC